MENHLELELPFIWRKMINAKKISASSNSFRIEPVNQNKPATDCRREMGFFLLV